MQPLLSQFYPTVFYPRQCDKSLAKGADDAAHTSSCHDDESSGPSSAPKQYLALNRKQQAAGVSLEECTHLPAFSTAVCNADSGSTVSRTAGGMFQCTHISCFVLAQCGLYVVCVQCAKATGGVIVALMTTLGYLWHIMSTSCAELICQPSPSSMPSFSKLQCAVQMLPRLCRKSCTLIGRARNC